MGFVWDFEVCTTYLLCVSISPLTNIHDRSSCQTGATLSLESLRWCATHAHLWRLASYTIYDLGLSRTPISAPWWRWEQGETLALPVVLYADSSHQSLPLALQDDKQEWRAYLSQLGFNEVSVPSSLIGNHLVHQAFWQLSNYTALGFI